MNLSLNSLRLISVSLDDRLRLARKNAAHPHPDAAAFWPKEVQELEKLLQFIKSEIAHLELEANVAATNTIINDPPDRISKGAT